MQLSTEVVGDVGVIGVRGEVDTISAPQLHEAAVAMFGKGARSLVMDCAEIDFIASDGLAVMVRLHNQAHAHGGTVTVRNPSALTYRLMQATCLDTVFEIDGLPDPAI
jgi:stage II sporulation protein AA (anti-sigma F factor antagonist)